MNARRSIEVLVKVKTDEGKYCLQEIKGLKEGVVIKGEIDEGKAVWFKWNGEDAILWLNDNCEEIVPSKSVRKRSVRRLPKGYRLDSCVIVEGEDGVRTCRETLREALEDTHERNTKPVLRCWIYKDWNTETEQYGFCYGEGETKSEALEDFWINY